MFKKELNPKLSQNYAIVEKSIQYWSENFNSKPPLIEIAESLGLTESDLQKVFSEWLGVSPEQFLQYLSKAYTKKLLAKSVNLPNKDQGKEPDRDYEDTGENKTFTNVSINYETISPGENIQKGKGIKITYGFSPSPFADCMIATTRHGICSLMFEGEDGQDGLVKRLQAEWPKASLIMDNQEIGYIADLIFPLQNMPNGQEGSSLKIYLQDSEFNIKVWKALLKIPAGHVVCYQDIARYAGYPKAARAVGTAIGKNPISFLIPCHRVIRKNGEFGNYGGGPARKKAMIAWEAYLKRYKEQK